jgi:ribosomal-protein-alanine N-acetyltransferase
MLRDNVDRNQTNEEKSTNQDTLILTRIKSRHLDKVSEIEKLVFSAPWTKEALEFEFRQSHSFVVECNEVCVGFAMMIEEGSIGHITNVAVDPEFHRRGIGRSLMSAIIVAGDRLFLDSLTLETRISNTQAQNLYSQVGFVATNIEVDYYDLPVEDALIMEYFY